MHVIQEFSQYRVSDYNCALVVLSNILMVNHLMLSRFFDVLVSIM